MRWVTRGGFTRSVSTAGAVGFAAAAAFHRQVDVAAVLAEREAACWRWRDQVSPSPSAVVPTAPLIWVSLTLLLQDDVDHAGDRVRPVLGGGAVAQHLDVVDGRHRNRIDVGAGRAAADGLLDVDQRLLVAALAVHQHQQLVGPEAAQGGRADDVGAVADEGVVKLNDGSSVLQQPCPVPAGRPSACLSR
jgi:hypothetical protein